MSPVISIVELPAGRMVVATRAALAELCSCDRQPALYGRPACMVGPEDRETCGYELCVDCPLRGEAA